MARDRWNDWYYGMPLMTQVMVHGRGPMLGQRLRRWPSIGPRPCTAWNGRSSMTLIVTVHNGQVSGHSGLDSVRNDRGGGGKHWSTHCPIVFFSRGICNFFWCRFLWRCVFYFCVIGCYHQHYVLKWINNDFLGHNKEVICPYNLLGDNIHHRIMNIIIQSNPWSL